MTSAVDAGIAGARRRPATGAAKARPVSAGTLRIGSRSGQSYLSGKAPGAEP